MTFRGLVQRVLSKDSLCPSARNCPEARTVLCRECGTIWTPESISAPGHCPDCGVRSYRRQPCDDCGMTRLEADLESPAGSLFRVVHQIHGALEAGFHLTLDDVTAEEFQALQVLRSEIDKWHASKQGSGASDSRLPPFPRNG